MSQIFYRFIWNCSEHWFKFPLGRFAPYVFEQAFGLYINTNKPTTQNNEEKI